MTKHQLRRTRRHGLFGAASAGQEHAASKARSESPPFTRPERASSRADAEILYAGPSNGIKTSADELFQSMGVLESQKDFKL